jgi:fructose-1,6-bisphosphatase/inositol monophosphatase family enzyme
VSAAVTAADTIYQIDRVSEKAVADWFEAHWPADRPVELVMEGIEEGEAVTVPRGTPVARTEFKCILDPIDGTRNLMYDKRPAWTLAALAPQRGDETGLGDLVVAAMTELPTSKQWAADQVSGVRGCGPAGLVAERVDVRGGGRGRLALRPSQATDFKHGFASLVRFFPEGKALLARVEEEIWHALHGPGGTGSPLVFEDQYVSTGGQVYELLAGHDRMLGDLRPLALRKLGLDSALTCHPYDICTALLLPEAGGVVEAPEGGPLRAPLDTTSPVAWMGYANAALAAQVRPLLLRLIKEHF